MNFTLLIDSVATTCEVLIKSEKGLFGSVNYWMWIAVFELLIIINLIFIRIGPHKLSRKAKIKNEAMKEGEIDFSNIIKSSFHVKPLYDELKVKCHPDRFPVDKDKNKIAEELFQEISKNKTDYKKLIALREVAKQKLNIHF